MLVPALIVGTVAEPAAPVFPPELANNLTGIIQGVVAKQAVSPELFDAIKGLTQESSVIVTGKVRADKRAPGGYEIEISDAQVVQRVNPDDPYPITPKEHGTDFLMEHRHLWVRSPRQAAILRVRAEIIKAARAFLDDRGFTLPKV